MTRQQAVRNGCIAVLFTFVIASTPGFAGAQSHELYAGLIKSKGYVVGSPLSQSGFHKLVNEGDTTWAHIGWNIPRVSALAIDKGNPNTIFLACGNGVLRSLDGGSSWKIVTGWDFTEAQGIAIDQGNPSDVYAASAYGIWRTEDGGETWIESNVGFEKTYTQNVAVDKVTRGRVLAATDGGVYESQRAAEWRRVSDDVPIQDLHQSDADPTLWIAATRGSGVLLSTDAGSTWEKVKDKRVRGKHIFAAVLDPTDVNRMAAGGWKTGVLISTDGGRRWKKVTKGLPSQNVYEMVFDPSNPGRLYVATVEEGIFYTDDEGKTWSSAGMYGTLVFDMQFIPGGGR